MKTIRLPARELPTDDGYDVLVAGGGPAGCGAALAAARDGARVLLVEASAGLGGNMTTSLVTVWAPFGDDEQPHYFGGLALDIMSECKAGMPHVWPDLMKWVPADPELLKRIYDRRMREAGVDVCFDTRLADVLVDDGRVDAVVLSSKRGLHAVDAPVVVDCTGDGDLAAWAGADFLRADIDDGSELQPVSLCFVIANVDEEAYKAGPNLGAWNRNSPIYRIIDEGRYPEIPDSHLCLTKIGPGCYTFNAGHVWDVDGTDPASCSTAMMEGRQIADAYARAFRAYLPEAFGESFLVSTAPRLGVRETRRIVGEYYLTLDDYLARRSFADEIARNNYWIDIHTRKDEIEDAKRGVDHVGQRYERYRDGESHGIPYRCLIPKGLRNVLVAGRSISGDQAVMGAVRTMPCAMCLGEAAGAAAAQLTAEGRSDPRSVDVPRLRRRLRAAGAYLPDPEPVVVVGAAAVQAPVG